MENLLFFSLIFALFINFGIGAIDYSGVNRTFLSMYRGIFECSVSQVNEYGEPVPPFFDKERLENYIVNYFEQNLTRYVTHYKAAIYYFDDEDQTVCTSSYCSSVRISLDCEINCFFHFTKARNYYINEQL